MTTDINKYNIAVWALTPGGVNLGLKISKQMPDVDLHFSERFKGAETVSSYFNNLPDAVAQWFHHYHGHVFIMSTGIVIRIILPHIRHKTIDPAVVVVDDRGDHAISLLSGHIGGANSLTRKISEIIGAAPVITTATDKNNLPSIDLIAKNAGLFIENPDAIKSVNMALISGKKIGVHDPFHLITDSFPQASLVLNIDKNDNHQSEEKMFFNKNPGVFVDDIKTDLPTHILILRPGTLVAGIGCNRGTPKMEIKSFLAEIFHRFSLSLNSLAGISTIDLKKDETGLTALAEDLNVPINFFANKELNRVENITSPSIRVEKYVGVKSVCEASAILAAKNGKLIVPKQSIRNVTVAVARIPFTS
ncbi:MAG: cobalt-precorrin 5A hydrolase [Desulfobacteraceae bacterium]|nr:cobalt-precorrin 5A hydrolase [Desulfobacteraceae bacterium]